MLHHFVSSICICRCLMHNKLSQTPSYKHLRHFKSVHTVSFMSATLSGLIVLENPRPVDAAPSSIVFDGQMWLAPGHILTGTFHHYNSDNFSFSDISQYFTWIHVSLFFLYLSSSHILFSAC